MKRLLTICALAALAASGAIAPAAAAKEEPKAGKKLKAAAEIPPPPPGMGQVVFYRSSRMGALVSCKVHQAGQVVNRLPPGKYFIHHASPGAHEFSVKSEATDKLRLEIEEGETQYARCAIGMGIGVGRPNLSPQSREDFDKRGEGLDLMPPYKGEKDDKKD